MRKKKMSKFGRQLRQALKKECIAVPGVFNGLVGRVAAEKGFQAAYVSGAALTASAGVPDIGVLSLDHFTARIKEISQVSGLPLICDADTGFGEAEMVSRTTLEYIQAGAAALHLEDQVFPKRCGHLTGKALISKADMCAKVERAAAASAKHSAGEFVVCARTDARSVTGIEDALDRAKAYVASGADMIFPEGLQSREEFQLFAQEIKESPGGEEVFLLANMTEFGQTPYISVADFEKMGYHCVIFPVTTLRCAMKAVGNCLDLLTDREATVEPILGDMFSRKELYAALGYTPGKEWVWPDCTNERK